MPTVTSSDVLNAIRNGAHDVFAIAAALGVNHSNGTLRHTLADLKQAHLITIDYSTDPRHIDLAA